MAAPIRFDNSYARLPRYFHLSSPPVPVAAPRLVLLNRGLARDLGIDPDWLASPEGVQVLAGNVVPEGAEPVAMAYSGHQFGGFNPMMGDGRATLLGEVVGGPLGRRDIHLKGCGLTPFSGHGDGRSPLGPMVREFIIAEAMAALGIPTTRSLSVVATGEQVRRETMLPGGLLARVAASHIRVGTFEYAAITGEPDAPRLLADHVINRHYPEAAGAPNRYAAMLASVVERQAELVARWLLVGFVHGVMNTDNTAVSGETIDYGPCAFIDAYDPSAVFSSIDHRGRYAYGNQPTIALWNMTRFAEALLPLLSDKEEESVATAEAALAGFTPRFNAAYLGGLRRKVGLTTERDGDLELVRDLLTRMGEGKADFTATFRRLAEAAADPAADARVRTLFAEPEAFDAWANAWRERLALEPMDGAARAAAMRAVNPAIIPRNHLVEAAIEAAVRRDDFAPVERLVTALATPFEDRHEFADYAEPPAPGQGVYRTFCGL
jgi:uncharacterized protein YdiU (UPF0061 family)